MDIIYGTLARTHGISYNITQIISVFQQLRVHFLKQIFCELTTTLQVNAKYIYYDIYDENIP